VSQRRYYPANLLRQPFQIEGDARFPFIFVLFHPAWQISQFIPRKFQREAIDWRILRVGNRLEFRDAQSLRTCRPNQFRGLQISPAQCAHFSLDEIFSNQGEGCHPVEILLSLVSELIDCFEPILGADIKRLVSLALCEADSRGTICNQMVGFRGGFCIRQSSLAHERSHAYSLLFVVAV
jgi:hypothetical protein